MSQNSRSQLALRAATVLAFAVAAVSMALSLRPDSRPRIRAVGGSVSAAAPSLDYLKTIEGSQRAGAPPTVAFVPPPPLQGDARPAPDARPSRNASRLATPPASTPDRSGEAARRSPPVTSAADSASSGPAAANPSDPAARRIAFVTGRDFGASPGARNEIYLMRPDGSDQVRLTHLPEVTKDDLSWSPDGTRLVFRGSDGVTGGIWMVPVGSGEAVRLTTGDDRNPSWFPDGQRILFRRVSGLVSELWTVGVAAGPPRPLSADQDGPIPGAEYKTPAISPDGARVAYGAPSGGGNAIHVQALTGGEPQRVSQVRAFADMASWSPDGSKLVFREAASGAKRAPGPERGANASAISIVNVDGSGYRILVRRPVGSGRTLAHPSWSPDGARVIFSESPSPTSCQLWTINSDGSNEQRLTDDPFVCDGVPAWR